MAEICKIINMYRVSEPAVMLWRCSYYSYILPFVIIVRRQHNSPDRLLV